MASVNLKDIPPHAGAAGPTPPRAPWSVRRTTTIDTRWPDGPGKSMETRGHGRDLLTGADPARPQVLAEDRFIATISRERELLALASEPPRADVAKLIGSRAGSQLRVAIAEALPDELRRGTPLYLLLDDAAGASLVAGWAWSQWMEDWLVHAAGGGDDRDMSERRRAMEGVCIGFSPESPVMTGDPGQQPRNQPVGPLDDNGDPFAWHPLTVQDGPSARRARRIDVSLDGDLIRVSAQFQDSAPTPAGGRMAVHEYLVAATVDRATMTLRSLDADARILPFGYCPAATLNTGRIIGTRVADLRRTVLEQFPKTQGCTHLNDTMRALAEVPVLAAQLEQAMAAERVA